MKYLQENFDSGLKNVPEVDEDKTSIWIASVNTSLSGLTRRLSWSKEDVRVIEEAFKKFSVSKKREIASEFEKNDALKDIMNRTPSVDAMRK